MIIKGGLSPSFLAQNEGMDKRTEE